MIKYSLLKQNRKSVQNSFTSGEELNQKRLKLHQSFLSIPHRSGKIDGT
ncbi:hypothetical protein SAMN05421754_102417 [Nitrosomonas sp. Nm58]|nr:hypothetical protein SAMN05421754_102417 [Nitrosomonas sp. Nm58]